MKVNIDAIAASIVDRLYHEMLLTSKEKEIALPMVRDCIWVEGDCDHNPKPDRDVIEIEKGDTDEGNSP